MFLMAIEGQLFRYHNPIEANSAPFFSLVQLPCRLHRRRHRLRAFRGRYSLLVRVP